MNPKDLTQYVNKEVTLRLKDGTELNGKIARVETVSIWLIDEQTDKKVRVSVSDLKTVKEATA